MDRRLAIYAFPSAAIPEKYITDRALLHVGTALSAPVLEFQNAGEGEGWVQQAWQSLARKCKRSGMQVQVRQPKFSHLIAIVCTVDFCQLSRRYWPACMGNSEEAGHVNRPVI